MSCIYKKKMKTFNILFFWYNKYGNKSKYSVLPFQIRSNSVSNSIFTSYTRYLVFVTFLIYELQLNYTFLFSFRIFQIFRRRLFAEREKYFLYLRAFKIVYAPNSNTNFSRNNNKNMKKVRGVTYKKVDNIKYLHRTCRARPLEHPRSVFFLNRARAPSFIEYVCWIFGEN